MVSGKGETLGRLAAMELLYDELADECGRLLHASRRPLLALQHGPLLESMSCGALFGYELYFRRTWMTMRALCLSWEDTVPACLCSGVTAYGLFKMLDVEAAFPMRKECMQFCYATGLRRDVGRDQSGTGPRSAAIDSDNARGRSRDQAQGP